MLKFQFMVYWEIHGTVHGCWYKKKTNNAFGKEMDEIVNNRDIKEVNKKLRCPKVPLEGCRKLNVQAYPYNNLLKGL